MCGTNKAFVTLWLEAQPTYHTTGPGCNEILSQLCSVHYEVQLAKSVVRLLFSSICYIRAASLAATMCPNTAASLYNSQHITILQLAYNVVGNTLM